jgi:ABC-type lipoprotein release transport system permease subunit
MAIRIAHRALRRNTLRSTLTMLGVIIGVAAVIAMLAIGQGAQAAIRAQIASLGSHTLVIQPGSMTQSGVRYGWGSRTTLRTPDVQAILNECPAVAYATPLLRSGFQVVYTNQNWPTTVQGTGIEYLTIREWALACRRVVCVSGDRRCQHSGGAGETVAAWQHQSVR